ncbi:MAG: hypothetical protein NUW23_03570 [Firmicutes bacterium]|jgi:hypothetical protein|nr:hypothetical protein [Bacillota bacterium]
MRRQKQDTLKNIERHPFLVVSLPGIDLAQKVVLCSYDPPPFRRLVNDAFRGLYSQGEDVGTVCSRSPHVPHARYIGDLTGTWKEMGIQYGERAGDLVRLVFEGYYDQIFASIKDAD